MSILSDRSIQQVPLAGNDLVVRLYTPTKVYLYDLQYSDPMYTNCNFYPKQSSMRVEGWAPGIDSKN